MSSYLDHLAVERGLAANVFSGDAEHATRDVIDHCLMLLPGRTREASFVQASKVLMAEDHGGSALPRALATAGFLGELVVTTLFFLVAFVGVTRGFEGGPPRRRKAASPKLSTARTS